MKIFIFLPIFSYIYAFFHIDFYKYLQHTQNGWSTTESLNSTVKEMEVTVICFVLFFLFIQILVLNFFIFCKEIL